MSLLESTVDPSLRRSQDRGAALDGQRRRAVLLLRVSSSGQVKTDYDPEGLSIPTQRNGGTRKAESLNADVVREYIEPGVSGGSMTKRKAFKQLLADLRELHDVDYVIIWSVSRWARDNEDYWTARGLVNRAGAALLSVKEPIGDDSAHGIMFEGVMAAWAASQRIQISEDVSAGIRRKIEVGGTHSRASIGYLNVREPLPQGGEVRTVVVDRERAEIIQWGYEAYSTGLYSIADITTLLGARGLRSRPTPCYVSKPLSQSAVHALLSNRYYLGEVNYHGKYYPGRHEPIISEELFDRVQAVCAAHKLAGERDRKHQHYLKGSLFCGACGRQLTYSRNTGRGGTYEYFLCSANQRHECPQRAQRVDAVEAAIESHYRTIAITDADRERVRAAVEQKLSKMTETSATEIERCNKLLADLKTQERKLMEKDYRDEISAELFSEESTRIKRERLDATAIVARLNIHHETIQDALALVLAILSQDIHDLYLRATPTQRRFINQAIFEAIWISHDDIERSQLNAPFDEIRLVSEATRIVDRAAQRLSEGTQKARNGKAPNPNKGSGALAQGSIRTSMVELGGLEPPTSWVRSRRSPI
jgi:site-specific DNA recombinase